MVILVLCLEPLAKKMPGFGFVLKTDAARKQTQGRHKVLLRVEQKPGTTSEGACP